MTKKEEHKEIKETDIPSALEPLATHCPYCNSENFVKRGTRKKKHESIQLYLCKECQKTFSAQFVKGKRHPLHVIREALSYYHIGYSHEAVSSIIKKKYDISVSPSTISGWEKEFSSYCPYSRMRPYAIKQYKPQETIESVTLTHTQVYQYHYHRAKTDLILQEYPNRRFFPLKEYLESVKTETPHRYFQIGIRSSEIKQRFDTDQLYIHKKHNYAVDMAAFVLQSVKENKRRHDILQRFMIANDSVTVAVEVPVYIKKDDIDHMITQLGFQIPLPSPSTKQKRKEISKELVITGHIDIIQIRNGQIHIMDFKPHAHKEKPIEQLTWYALALSRLTGLRLYEFVCGWFDQNTYYEFFPLHAVYKKKRKKKWNKKVAIGEILDPKEMRPQRKQT